MRCFEEGQKSYHDSAQVYQDYYKVRFDSTENYNYDDAFLFFQDQVFSFDEYDLEILDHAFQLKEEYEISNLWGNKILAKLIGLNPAKYAGSVERERVILESDESWLVSKSYTAGYNREDFDDSGWTHAGIVASAYNQFIDLGVDPKPMWWPTKPAKIDTSQLSPFDTTFGMIDSTSGGDSLAVAGLDTSFENTAQPSDSNLTSMTEESLTDSAMGDTVQLFFRKKLNLEGSPVGGTIYMTADNDFNFFLNGEYITDDEGNNFAILDTVDYGYISYSIKPGINTFAIRAIDTDKSGGGVKLYGYFELIPQDITASVEERSRVAALNIDPTVLRRINTLNKNRISIGQ